MVGSCVRTFRLSAGLTLSRLARESGVSEALLQKVETGATPCPLFVARNIAEIVDCTLDDLVPVMIDEVEES
jgi:transcriptional regulator with XRE-family HTH domain